MKVTCSPSSKRYDPAFKKWCQDHGFNRIDPEFRKDQLILFEQYNQLPSKTTEPALYANMVSYSREDIEFGQWCRDRGYKHVTHSGQVLLQKNRLNSFTKKMDSCQNKEIRCGYECEFTARRESPFDTEFNQWCRERGLGMG